MHGWIDAVLVQWCPVGNLCKIPLGNVAHSERQMGYKQQSSEKWKPNNVYWWKEGLLTAFTGFVSHDVTPSTEDRHALPVVSVGIGPLSHFLGGSTVKNPPAIAGDASLIPGSGRSPGEGKGNPLQYSCPGNPVDKGVWWARAHGVTKELDMT